MSPFLEDGVCVCACVCVCVTTFLTVGFSYCGPGAWNTLPSDLHDITDTGTFRKRLKSVLYDRAYH